MDKLLVWIHVHIMEANVPHLNWICQNAKSSARQYNTRLLFVGFVSLFGDLRVLSNSKDAPCVLVKKIKESVHTLRLQSFVP